MVKNVPGKIVNYDATIITSLIMNSIAILISVEIITI